MALKDEIEAGVEPLRVPKHGGRGTRKRALIAEGGAGAGPPGYNPVRPVGPGGPEQAGAETAGGPGEDEVAQFHQAETNILKLIHKPEAQEKFLKAMNDSTRPVHEAVGALSGQMLMTLAEQMQAAGEEPSPNVLTEIGTEVIVPELFAIGQQAGIFPEMDEATEQEEIGKALLSGMQTFGNMLLDSPDSERIVQEAQQALAERVAEEADAGTLDPQFAAHLREQNPRMADQLAAANRQPAAPQEM